MHRIEVTDLTPKFLKFYEVCQQEMPDVDRRWELWKEHYGFAAVPPTEEGMAKARVLLDNAWVKYAERIPSLTSKNYLEQYDFNEMFSRVAALFELEQEADFNVLLFVGNFDGNAFVSHTQTGKLLLAFPVEDDSFEYEITMAHECAHIAHNMKAELSSSWERSIGRLILEEGVAIHTSKALVPGKPEYVYPDLFSKGEWLARCQEKDSEIIKGIIPYLEDTDSDRVYQFTMGTGTTGTEREAYYVGWKLVGKLLDEGVTLAELASIKEKEIPGFIRGQINKI